MCEKYADTMVSNISRSGRLGVASKSGDAGDLLFSRRLRLLVAST
jgi:hypothetical protein